MAKNNRAVSRANNNIRNIAKSISGNMDDLYRSTYMSSPQQNRDLENLSAKINDNLDKIVNKNMEMVGIPSVSKLYSRIANNNNSRNNEIINDLRNVLDNGMVADDLYGMFMSNRYLRELDCEIDTVCKYMPKLEEALAVQRDCVLSADHFSKDFLSFTDPGGTTEDATFNERIKDLKRKYELPKLIEEIYDDTSKYGERFIYRVPYADAIGRLLATKQDTPLVTPLKNGLNESSIDELTGETDTYLFSIDSSSLTITNESGVQVTNESATILKESVKHLPSGDDVTERVPTSVLKGDEKFNIAVQICKSGVIESAVLEAKEAFEKRTKYTAKSLNRIHEHRILREANNSEIEAKGNKVFEKEKADKRIIANDGLVNGQDIKPVTVKTPGSVVKKLPRDHVLPIYIEDMCMGYFYMELRSVNETDAFMGFRNILGDPLTNMRGDGKSNYNAVDNERQDDTIKYLAGQLSKFINKQFVNSNQDLAKEIYMILKYNDLFNTPSTDLIRVTFVPPEDIVHFFFRQDPVTHRGISDLDRALVPAKIYSSLYITTAIGNLTRGQDKRVYYVKQAVDTNIAQTLLNTISQIKMSNFGIRQFQSINNVLNITGRFNDYIIPTNQSGDAPIQFEVMPGQQIETPSELMTTLEEMAINSTGIPLEIIQTRQSVDYAMQLTMSSSKVLRFCYKRQELFEYKIEELVGPMYNYEYDETSIIEVKLPPPSFINITNTDQLLQNTKSLADNIANSEPEVQQDEDLKTAYSNNLFKHYIGTHLDTGAHQKILDRTKIEVETRKNASSEE